MVGIRLAEERAVHILIVDDEAAIRDVLGAYLREEGFRVLEARDGIEAVDVALAERPDLIVLDLNLPGRPGFDVIRAIRAETRVPIIVLSSRSGEPDRVLGLEMGADDYVAKPFSPRELVARVKGVLRRYDRNPPRRRVSKGVLRFADLEIDRAAHEVREGGRQIKLTPTEFRILEVLIRAPGRAFAREVLLGRISGSGDIVERTLDRHIANLRHKLERDPANPRYVLTVFGIGYKFAKPAAGC
jgi:two-component system alkaline phosphatase synthesis response regulator PhoP